ncbi:MAG TPA: Maf family protein [Candidatus Brocadiales bacterium]|nr:Maf family protein [Candidatus Brocadiales bacterium]
MYKTDRTIILASTSPRRRELLRLTGLRFKVKASDYEEDLTCDLPPHALAIFLSKEKARSVAKKYKNAIVIAADTFISFRGKIFGKPHTEEESMKMLKALNGKAHSVISGFTIIDTNSKKVLSKAIETKVYFRRLSIKEIEAYVKSGETTDKAGAYAIQGLGSVIIRRIEGDYFNVIGLPICALIQGLKKFGINT